MARFVRSSLLAALLVSWSWATDDDICISEGGGGCLSDDSSLLSIGRQQQLAATELGGVAADLSPTVQCPGSASMCAGSQCCPGTSATHYRTFPCPNAKADYDRCAGNQTDLVAALLSAMTREEKHDFIRGSGWVDYNPLPGYYIGDAALRQRFGIPSLNMQDNGQGFRTVTEEIISQVTSWPCALAAASSWSEVDNERWAIALGKEFKIKGANVILGPGLNVHRVALGGRSAEYFSGESPYFGARMAKPYVKGVQSQNVLAVAKHFVLNNQETNRDVVNSFADPRTLWEVYYPPFEAAVEAGVASFMCSYNLVNGKHACGNSDILLRDLKQDMGFEGWVQSDWWALHSFAAVDGVDQEMPGDASPGGSKVWFTDENLDTLSDAKVDNMVGRMLSPMLQYGLFEPRNHACLPPDDCSKQLYEANATSPEHQKLSKEMAIKAMLLLKNTLHPFTRQGKVLPFTHKVKKIALLGAACDAKQDVESQLSAWDAGSCYNIGGSGRVIAWDPVTIYAGLQAECEQKGCEIQTYFGTNASEAIKKAEGANVAILCGCTTSTEGHDRASLSVDDEDFMVEVARRIKTMPVITLTMTPGAIVMPWIKDTDAALNVFLAGKYTGTAFASALFGDSNPSAKLLVTFPVSESDTVLPCKQVYPDVCNYTEGLYVGYLALEGAPVTFPFGHGLSYTQFKYVHVGDSKGPCKQRASKDAKVCISAKVKNSGEVKGIEVAQLYLTYPLAAGEPANQLRGFVRTDELDPDSEIDIDFPLTERDLSYYDAKIRAWKLATGEFTVSVGSSSRDIRFQTTFTIH